MSTTNCNDEININVINNDEGINNDEININIINNDEGINNNNNNTNKNDLSQPYIPDLSTEQEKMYKNTVNNLVRRDDDEQWAKIQGWSNELLFYSKVFQYFGEIIKDKEGMLGWWIIMISSFSSFITLFSLDPFSLTEINNIYYNWTKSVILAIFSLTTTLIAAWIKKKGYINRIQIIDKRINRLERFLGKLDYQSRLVPYDKKVDYFEFIKEVHDEYTELSIYTDILRPAEFTYTVYLITRFNSPMVVNTWPWYDTKKKTPRRKFSQNIINVYEKQYSFWSDYCPCEVNIDRYNELLNNIEANVKT